MPGQATEVEPREALKGKSADHDQAPDAPKAKPEETKDVIDTIQPKAEPRTWKLGKGEHEREYVQRPLSFFAKMNFFALVGEVIDKAVSGDDGIRVSSLFDSPMGGDGMSLADFRDADMFIQGAGKLLSYAPDLLEKSYCIWLDVPDHERPLAIALMSQSVEDGGLSDDDGIEMIEVFIDQNWESIEDFFRNKIASLRDRVQARRKTTEEGQTDK